MTTLKQMGLGALFSIVLITVVHFLQGINLAQYTIEIIWGIYAITLFLWIVGIILRSQILSLNKLEVDGDLEDEIEVKKYRKFSDMSLSLQVSSTLAIIGTSMALMLAIESNLVLIGAVMTIGSFMLGVWMMNVVQEIYPERNLPKVTDEKYADKLLAKSDEGEKHVMLHGLYKSYNLVNILLVFAMLATAIYSSITGDSQLFAIIIMGAVLIATNSRYMFAIRNK